jgi:hypothetical protein
MTPSPLATLEEKEEAFSGIYDIRQLRMLLVELIGTLLTESNAEFGRIIRTP